jgi:hypothetical protein
LRKELFNVNDTELVDAGAVEFLPVAYIPTSLFSEVEVASEKKKKQVLVRDTTISVPPSKILDSCMLQGEDACVQQKP